jgi:SNF2 family DNA or RNA helicase
LIAKPVKDKHQYGLSRLQDLVRATCLRRTISGLNAEILQLLPPKSRIEWIRLGDDEELYKFFKLKTASVASGRGKNRAKGVKDSVGRVKGDENILSLISFLRMICNYGERMLPAKALEAWRERDLSSIDWQAMETMQHRCAGCGGRVRDIDDGNILLCGHHVCEKCQLHAEEADEGELDEVLACSACRDSDQNGEHKQIIAAPGASRSAKAQALIRNILDQQSSPWASPPQKRLAKAKSLPVVFRSWLTSYSIVFSCWTRMLDLVQKDLKDVGLGIQRIDGQASLPQRRAAMEQFKSDPNCTVMLASIGSAGEG